MTTEQIDDGIESGELLERYISYYGDGAVLGCGKSLANCRCDDEGETAIVRVVMPKRDYLDVRHYCNGNAGPRPFSDAYEAAQVVAATAVETEVYSCDVAEHWTPAECDRLGGCFLCGGDHRNL